MREFFFFFSIRGSRRRSISGLSANLSPLFSLLSLKQHFLYSISFHSYHVDFSAYSSPIAGFFTQDPFLDCCYEWRREERERKGER